MRSFGKKRQRVLSAFLMGLLLMPCSLQSQTANQQVWWLKTDKGQYIEMSRVRVLTNVNKEANFEVVVHQGQGASGVVSVSFEKNSLVVVKGDANGDGFVNSDDVKEIAAYILGKESDNFSFDRADVNGNKKVDLIDLVAVVDIAKTPKIGVRGMTMPLEQLTSTSGNGLGTKARQGDSGAGQSRGDEAGTKVSDGETWPIEPLPGTINPPYNQPIPEPTKIEPEPITIEPEPEQITPREEPATDLGSVPYFRVQFTEDLLKVKAYAADGFTFFNPAYDYLDFKYSLPFTHANLDNKVDANSFYYIGTGPDPSVRTRFTLAKTDGSLAIKGIIAYNLPVKSITVFSEGLSRESAGKRTITYTFNALPRNIEELKTLEVNNREYFSSPHFVTALFICCLNRLTDNSSDAWNMINYLRTHTAIVGENNILKVSNVDMQNIVQNLLGNDSNGKPVSNGLRSYFAGSSPNNQYTPTTPYQVTVVEQSDVYTTEDGYRCAKLYVESSGSDYLIGPLKLRKTGDHGWLIYSGEQVFTKQMKSQN